MTMYPNCSATAGYKNLDMSASLTRSDLRSRDVGEEEAVEIVVEEGGESAPLGPEHVADGGRPSGVGVEQLS